MDNNASPSQLLSAAITDPFIWDLEGSDAVSPWFKYATAVVPLWTLQSEAYLRLQPGDLPSTLPMRAIIRSILRDEGIERNGWLDPLPSTLDRRRCAVCRGKTWDQSYFAPQVAGSESLHPGTSSFKSCEEPDQIVDWDDEGPVGAHSVYEEIGRELVELIQLRDSEKPGTEEAEEAKRRIDDFLKRISARRGKGRPPKGTTDEILKALYNEGSELLGLAWQVCPPEPSVRTRKFLKEHGVTDTTEQALWAAHLVLPMLSSKELGQVLRFVEERGWITPRRLAIIFLAHRLGLERPHVARRLVGFDEEEEFKNHPEVLI